MPRKPKQTALTTKRQQENLRDTAVRAGAQAMSQMVEYMMTNQVEVAGKPIPVTPERLKVWDMLMKRSLPELKGVEITQKSSLESMTNDQLWRMVLEHAAKDPKRRKQLEEAFGGRVINGTCTATTHVLDTPSAPEKTQSDFPAESPDDPAQQKS